MYPFTTGAWGLPLLFLDFETYYSTKDGYTLTKMPPEEYIRNAKFQVLGLVAMTADGQVYVAKGPEQVRALLQALDVSRWCCVSHNNGGFDGLILTLHYGMRPGAMQCTLDMARPHMPPGQRLSLSALATYAQLGAKGDEVLRADGKRFEDFTAHELHLYIDVYCAQDTALCRGLYAWLRSTFYAHAWGQWELEVLSETLMCAVIPHYQDDSAILAEEVERLTRLDEQRERRLLQVFQCDQPALHKFLGSGKRLAAFLQAMGVEPPTKPSKSDPTKTTFAFAKDDEAFTILAADPDDVDDADPLYPWHLSEDVRALLSDVVTARLGVKSSIRRNRAERMLAISRRGPYTWPVTWRGAGATGRWAALSAAKTNWQNVPIERRKGYPQEALRRARKPAPTVVGMPAEPLVLVSADSSQVEARCVVTAAGQEDMRQMFEAPQPVIYEHMASQVYQRTITKDDPERQTGKFTILGAGFGASGGTLYKQMRKAKVPGVTLEIADLAVGTYRTNAPDVVRAWGLWNQPLKAIEKGRSYAGLVLEFGPHNPGTGRAMFIVQFIEPTSFVVWLPSGRPLYYRDIRWELIKSKGEEGWTYMGREEKPDGRVIESRNAIYGAKLFQNWVQAVSADCIGYAAWLMRRNYGHTLAGNTHDELNYIAPVSQAALVLEQLLWCMRQRPAWLPTIPLNAEGKWGSSYAEV